MVFCLNSKYYLEDGSAATENILIQASDLGIGSCWVAGDKKPYCDKVKQLLKVTDKYKLISIIALGYPQQSPGPIEKRAIKDVVHWEAFLTKTLYQKEFKGNNGKSKKSKPKEKNSKKTGESCQKTKNASPKTIKKQKSSKGFFTQG
ncbi:MAG: hypothetical protein A2460_09100 [Omnitrophica WOR_2 bacterium RIFOXYC2_FULL_43_9]|nr:MAG: hypothetical protein A2460_09100 [Omnitrophica WOR_2 bacterium RIFOXYC2_FULL_43_9]